MNGFHNLFGWGKKRPIEENMIEKKSIFHHNSLVQSTSVYKGITRITYYNRNHTKSA